MLTKKNRTALVTGSSRGLGRMAARLLAEAGWSLAVHCRDHVSEAGELAEDLKRQGSTVHVFQADLSRRGPADRLVEEVIGRFGGLDALVHAVGPFVRERRRFADYTPEEIDAMVDGNLKSALHTTHASLPHLRKSGHGRIILFGFGRVGEAPAWPDRAAYAASKTGLVSFVKTLSVEEAPFGVTANMVCPGDIVGENKEKRISEVMGCQDGETPLGRPGTGEDVARVIRFLCSPESDFVTGNLIQVTGGLDVIHPASKAKR
ncbi:3-oxoacyl-[acyl-carrier protein] reductase [Melghirimyces profundicolus]|uniref:3-oxoacyl-[acyl-carrier protein] reductase n=1 Tax=Melghirimyces profundicolus TaxID=1242148 RepID=A0A2T6BSS7_9BACL|nr:SDR family oxidoreductase [Melghirimyces profundicolus]PTX59089.1 3-oxoacyl-[acyl-carrier protein] reductase [Melghirimyces profundicolus]